MAVAFKSEWSKFTRVELLHDHTFLWQSFLFFKNILLSESKHIVIDLTQVMRGMPN